MNRITDNGLTWASRHDWFVSAQKSRDGFWTITVLERFTDTDNQPYSVLQEFDNFTQLLIWAGY